MSRDDGFLQVRSGSLSLPDRDARIPPQIVALLAR